jgi:hypothetical protein
MYSNAIEPARKLQDINKNDNANKFYDNSGYIGRMTAEGRPDMRYKVAKKFVAETSNQSIASIS